MEGIWYMAVYKDKNKNTWYVSKRYSDWDGSKKRLFKRGFQTKREALEYELSFVSRISDNQKMLFKDFIPIYYEDLEKRVRKNTMITKKNIIEINIYSCSCKKNTRMKSMTKKTSRNMAEWSFSTRWFKLPQSNGTARQFDCYFGLHSNMSTTQN